MKAWKSLLMLVCLLSMLVQQQVNGQAALAPVENYVVNRAVGGIIANRIMAARGIAANDATWLASAANDPVYQATMAGVSSAMTKANVASTALGVGLSIAGAPVWLTVAASLGVIAVGAVITGDMASQSSFSIVPSYSPNGGNVIRVANKPMALPPYTSGGVTGNGYGIDLAISNGANVYRNPTSCFVSMPCYGLPPLPANAPMKYYSGYVILVANTVDDLAKYYVMMQQTPLCTDACGMPGVTLTLESAGSGFVYSDNGKPQWYVWIHETRSGGDAYGMESYDRTYYQYPTGASFASGSYPQVFKDLDSAYQALDADLKAATVPQYIIAGIADEAWKQAASQPDYSGLPYSTAQPVSVADVATWQTANPSTAPTLDDMLRPAQNAATNPAGVPISPTVQPNTPTSSNPGTDLGTNPGTNTNPSIGTNVNVVNAPKVDLGPDPGTTDPSLEQIPDAGAILSPLTSLFPELRSFHAPAHTGECPRPRFDLFGKSIVMDSQCTIAEQHRGELAAVMLAVWILVGLFILLSA